MLLTICLSSKCRKDSESCHHHIYIRNQSNVPVYINASFSYPDTSIQGPNPALSGDYQKVNPGQTGTPINRSACFEDVFQDEIPSGYLQVFVFEAPVLESNPWEVVTQNYLVAKRYTVSLQELRNSDFTITYP